MANSSSGMPGPRSATENFTETGPLVPSGLDSHDHFAVRRGELDGISQQIEEHLLHVVRITHDTGEIRQHIETDLDVPGLCHRDDPVNAPFDEGGRVKGHRADRHGPGLEPRNQQQVVQQIGNTDDFSAGNLEKAPLPLVNGSP